METVSMTEARARLSQIVEEAEVAAGEDVVISKAGTPRVRLVPLQKRKPSRFGVLGGSLVLPDDFDAQLPIGELRAFAGAD